MENNQFKNRTGRHKVSDGHYEGSSKLSRVELHGSKYKKSKGSTKGKKKESGKRFRISIPSLLLILLLLLPISILYYFLAKDEKPGTIQATQTSGEEISFEESTEKSEPEPIQKEDTANAEVKEEPKQQEAPADVTPDAEDTNKEETHTPKPAQEAPERQPEENSAEAENGKWVYHTVQPGETLYRIAMKYYKSQSGIEKIREANGIQGNEISSGQTLKVPLP